MLVANTATATPSCAAAQSLFQHPLVEEPPASSAPSALRRQSAALVRQAESVCSGCPLMQKCLYDAVVNFDVDGFAGGTTRKERNQLRTKLGITVAPEDFDTLAGVTARHRQVDHDEVVRLRNANPHESLEMLAHRLGCSLSTVKRHLRKARKGATVTELRRTTKPSLRTVLEALYELRRTGTVPARRAA